MLKASNCGFHDSIIRSDDAVLVWTIRPRRLEAVLVCATSSGDAHSREELAIVSDVISVQ